MSQDKLSTPGSPIGGPDDRPDRPVGMVEDEPRGPVGKAIVVFLGLVVIFIVGMWAYVFTGIARRPHPDTLASPAYSEAAESICSTAKVEFDEIPLLGESEDVVVRADLIDEGLVVLNRLVDDLTEIAPSDDPVDGPIVERWLSDWGVHLDDRIRYSAELRKPEATLFVPFLETQVENRQISDRLDTFAEVNKMPSCIRPPDL